MFLEVSALMYEAIVKGVHSTWLPYFQSLPTQYPLPVNYRCTTRCKANCRLHARQTVRSCTQPIRVN